jgi:hypothetical protein
VFFNIKKKKIREGGIEPAFVHLQINLADIFDM